MKKLLHVVPALLAGLLLAPVVGCTHMMKVSVTTTRLPSTPKLPQRAVLVLDQDFGGYNWEMVVGAEKWVLPFGPALEEYARNVAGQVFQETRVAPSLEQAVSLEKPSDVILIPHAVQSDYVTTFTGALQTEKNCMLVVEWVARDRASQSTIWRKTISASASVTAATALAAGRRHPILMQKLFDDLSTKTYEAFHQAAELRATKP